MLTEGTIIIIDLDNFSEMIKQKGWSEWRPNDATALLTTLVHDLVNKWSAHVIWGLDEERGTEEVIIEIPLVEPSELKEDLEYIRRRLNEIGVGVSIVAIKDFVGVDRATQRRDAYKSTPGRRRALKLLKALKRRGGNAVLIVD
ncbi:hypothetical protein IPA_04350 [Ignicoccus pacificus DSM 13166]|uniref:Uncharacterized protein n=1 Tax=Ignicoccus pacificus DSM 13166 TaxID=940294 RepID=A0A977K9E3_9CREN|nr:hypothetical protein IPA_04350 [Ignicoccus pacificus DSM 13166]